MQQIEITTEYIKLDSFLKFAGVCETGGQTKAIIASGQCKVNGAPCTARGTKLRPKDIVELGQTQYEVVSHENREA